MATVYDTAFRLVYMTDELRRSYAGLQGLAVVAIGLHYLAPESLAVRKGWAQVANSLTELEWEAFTDVFPELLPATPSGRPALRELVDPCFHDLVDQLSCGVRDHASVAPL